MDGRAEAAHIVKVEVGSVLDFGVGVGLVHLGIRNCSGVKEWSWGKDPRL